jgi:3-oxoacyl-[acyl-carrier protein] reductase
LELDLQGKVALVTAASRGLGRACAVELGREGMRVAMGVRDPESPQARDARDAVAAAGGEPLLVAHDLTDPARAGDAVATVLDTWGALDALVANAPGPDPGPFEALSLEQWESALRVNVLSMVTLTQAALKPMKTARGGRITYIATVGVKTAQPEMVLSNASRLALVGLAKTVSIEVAEHEILVNVVAPGPLETDRMTNLVQDTAARLGVSRDEAEAVWIDEVPLKRSGRPEDLASVVALLASDRCSYITGTVIPIDGGKARTY